MPRATCPLRDGWSCGGHLLPLAPCSAWHRPDSPWLSRCWVCRQKVCLGWWCQALCRRTLPVLEKLLWESRRTPAARLRCLNWGRLNCL